MLVTPVTDTPQHLRIPIANQRKDRLALVAPVVVALGHEVIAREIDVEDVDAVTARERPDVALVGLGASSQHALDLIDKIVREAACPVIALLHEPDPGFVKEASKRGVFAHISDDDVEDWQTRSTSSCAGSRSITILKARSVAGLRSNARRASSWNATPSTRTRRLRCYANDHASRTENSSTSPPRSSTATASSQSNHKLPSRRRPGGGTHRTALAVDHNPPGGLARHWD